MVLPLPGSGLSIERNVVPRAASCLVQFDRCIRNLAANVCTMPKEFL
jgi:hypothetical protein